MAKYTLLGSEIDLFDLAPGEPLAQTMRSHTAQKIVLSNWDGSNTILFGSGLVWDAALGRFTAGIIQSIRHSSDGKVVDVVAGLTLSVSDVQSAMENTWNAPHALRDLVLAGNDTIDARYRPGGAAVDDFLVGEGGNDSIAGGAGDDEIFGGRGSDTIDGNNGNDFINGGLDDDLLRGMPGNDRLTGDGGADTLSGGLGDDVLYGGAGNDLYLGESGLDTVIYTRSLGDLLIDAEGAELLIIEPNGHDTLRDIERIATDEGIFAWAPGTETLTQLSATPGALLLNPGTATYGTQGNDRLVLRIEGKTTAIAKGGNDSIIGSGEYDLLIGGEGNDRIAGDRTADQAGGDRLYGNAGNDRLSGNGGNDLLYGGAENDRLNGGRGNDTMSGGDGGDVFLFNNDPQNAALEQWGDDIINDFRLHTDRLQFVFNGVDKPTPELAQVDAGWIVWVDGYGSILLKGLDVPSLTLHDLLT